MKIILYTNLLLLFWCGPLAGQTLLDFEVLPCERSSNTRTIWKQRPHIIQQSQKDSILILELKTLSRVIL